MSNTPPTIMILEDIAKIVVGGAFYLHLAVMATRMSGPEKTFVVFVWIALIPVSLAKMRHNVGMQHTEHTKITIYILTVVIGMHLIEIRNKYQGYDLPYLEWTLSLAYLAVYLFGCYAIENTLEDGVLAALICFFILPVG
jgi:hypothetical protein